MSQFLLMHVGLSLDSTWTRPAAPMECQLGYTICANVSGEEHHSVILSWQSPNLHVSLASELFPRQQGFLLFFLSVFRLHRHCFLIRSMFSITPLGSLLLETKLTLLSVVYLNMIARCYIQKATFNPIHHWGQVFHHWFCCTHWQTKVSEWQRAQNTSKWLCKHICWFFR